MEASQPPPLHSSFWMKQRPRHGCSSAHRFVLWWLVLRHDHHHRLLRFPLTALLEQSLAPLIHRVVVVAAHCCCRHGVVVFVDACPRHCCCWTRIRRRLVVDGSLLGAFSLARRPPPPRREPPWPGVAVVVSCSQIPHSCRPSLVLLHSFYRRVPPPFRLGELRLHLLLAAAAARGSCAAVGTRRRGGALVVATCAAPCSFVPGAAAPPFPARSDPPSRLWLLWFCCCHHRDPTERARGARRGRRPAAPSARRGQNRCWRRRHCLVCEECRTWDDVAPPTGAEG